MKALLRTAVVMALLAPSLVMAQEVADDASKGCGLDINVAAEQLDQKFGEVLMGVGITQQIITSLFVNEDTQTFTVLITKADGDTCMIAGGENWEFVVPKVGDPT